MSFISILTIYVLPPILALVGAFFGVLFGSAITIRYFNAKTKAVKPAGATYNNKKVVSKK